MVEFVKKTQADSFLAQKEVMYLARPGLSSTIVFDGSVVA